MNLRALTTVSGAGVIAAAVQAISLVLVARLSSPEIIGGYALWLSFSAIIGALISARADTLILAASSELDALETAANAVRIALLACAAITVLAFTAWLGGLVGLGLPIAVVGAFLTSRFDIQRSLLIRRRKSGAAASLLASRSLIAGGLLITTAYLSDYSELLLGANFASFAFASPIKFDRWRLFAELSRLKDHLVKYRRQYLFGAPSAVISTFYLQGLPIVFAYAFDEAAAGAVYLVVRAVQLPVGLLARATSELATAEISRGLQLDPRRRVERFLGLVSALLLSAAILVCLVDVERMVDSIFGKDWTVADFSIKTGLSLMLAFAAVQFFVSPLTTDFTRFGRQKWMLIWELGRASLLLGGIIGLRAFGADLAFFYWTIVGALSYGLLHFLRKAIVQQQSRR